MLGGLCAHIRVFLVPSFRWLQAVALGLRAPELPWLPLVFATAVNLHYKKPHLLMIQNNMRPCGFFVSCTISD